jgi:CHAT domain-containing protein
VAAAKAGGYALVVAGGHDPQYVHLPHVRRDAVAEQLAAMLPGGPAKRMSPFTLTRGLRWLAEKGIRDILIWHARGRVVTLVPVGLLSLLPLHAASDQRGNYVGDYSAIRYAPNVRTLLRCRDSARTQALLPLRLLAVDVPDGFGVPERNRLAHVARETAEVSRIWTGRHRDGLVVDNCTWEEFRRTAEDYTVWHIACHGSSSPYGVGSSVYFADAEVTLEQMAAQLRPGPRRLAVLSACESHLTGAAMPNEVVGLPTVLLQLGFSGVIATAWRIDDAATTYLMTCFYQTWSTGEVPPAVALNQAQRWLRTATRDDLAQLIPDMAPAVGDSPHPYANPYYWAAFAYTGA